MSPGRMAAFAFLALSAGLAAGAWALPGGVGSVPGPAFFPLGIAAAMAALSIALLFQVEPAPSESSALPGAWKRIGGVVALLFFYLLLWGTGLFAVRTAVFLCLMLRWTGQGWRASAGVAATLTAIVVLAFQAGLKVALE
jgi:Tripartite tricarboxylate transporter TctB family